MFSIFLRGVSTRTQIGLVPHSARVLINNSCQQTVAVIFSRFTRALVALLQTTPARTLTTILWWSIATTMMRACTLTAQAWLPLWQVLPAAKST